MVESQGLRAAFRMDSVVFYTPDAEMTVQFLGATRGVRVEPVGSAVGAVNFLAGPRGQWRTGVSTYSSIAYRGLYNGIDLRYSGADSRLKSEFVVSPGADPRQIRLRYPAAGRLSIASNGDLVFRGAGGELRDCAPAIYSDSAGGRVPVKGRYLLLDDHTAGFQMEAYDAAVPLVIDPVISFSTFFGGSGIGAVTGVAADNAGNMYIAGWTEASNLPVAGAAQYTNRGGVDAFVAKLNSSGALVYGTYIGGNSDDRAAAIAVDSSGNAYVTGSTASTNFPLVAPVRSILGGRRDAFALKLNASGNALIYSTYLGGSGWDQGTTIAVDGSANAYIAGDTQSTDFPVLSPTQAIFGGLTDVFVSKLSPSGSLISSTFLGGSSTEHAGGIAVDPSGAAYVAGSTYSMNFPLHNAFSASSGGGQDAFVTKLTASALIYSTYLGGSGADQANAIAIDSGGNAYVTGVTMSPNFPASSGALRTVYNGLGDAFAAKLNAAGSGLVYGTYLGGSTSNAGNGIAVDSSGDAYVVGATTSFDFPVVNGTQGTLNGGQNAFISKLAPSGASLSYSTYYGGSGMDMANSVALDSSGHVYVGGQTSSPDFPLTAALEPNYPGTAAGWMVKLADPKNFSSAADNFLGPGTTPDILWQNPSNGEAILWFMGGSGGTTEVGSLILAASEPGWHLAGAVDFNGDGNLDLIWQNVVTGQAIIWYLNGGITEQVIGSLYLSSQDEIGWTIVAAADFNGDGVPDVVWQNSSGQAIVWYMGGFLGATQIGSLWLDSTGMPGSHIAAVADFNLDGRPDVLWQNNTTGQLTIWYLNGSLGVTQLSTASVPASGMAGWSVVAAADFNGDGQPDLIWQNNSSYQVQIWYMDSKGTSQIGSAPFGFGGVGWNVL